MPDWPPGEEPTSSPQIEMPVRRMSAFSSQAARPTTEPRVRPPSTARPRSPACSSYRAASLARISREVKQLPRILPPSSMFSSSPQNLDRQSYRRAVSLLALDEDHIQLARGVLERPGIS